MSKHRVLWVLNHTTLRRFEVPLLMSMGYEVFCPKLFDVNFGDLSASVSYEFDKSLTISKEDLNYLNHVDFYKELSPKTLGLVNKYFDIAFCMNTRECLRSLAFGFNGVLILHAFGLEGSNSYTSSQEFFNNEAILTVLAKRGNKFFFGQAYRNLCEIESPVFARRALYMPLGLLDNHNNRWVGGDKRILFVCPRIKSNTYYRRVYDTFYNDFGDIPHAIGGQQMIPVLDDPTVLGFLNQNEYVYNMTHLSAMFYHSQEPRHLHYHPLEAIQYGMPLVFMGGGMLDQLGGKNLPGRCRTIHEARNKLTRLSKGDQKLANTIISSQKVLLKEFSLDYCASYWKSAMNIINNSIDHTSVQEAKKRVAVVVPAEYTGGVLDYSIRFAKSIYLQSKEAKDNLEIIFSYPDSLKISDYEQILDLKKHHIQIRTFHAEIKSAEWLNNSKIFQGIADHSRLKFSSICVLRDGIKDFNDCNFVFVTSDVSPLGAPIYWTVPHAVVAHDYIQHYVKNVIPRDANLIKLSNQRMADYVLVTSMPAYQDALSYGGISKEKVRLTPYMLESVDISTNHEYGGHKYFMWSTNAAPHKNHIRAIKAIEQYYRNGGTYDCFMTGVNTNYFRNNMDLDYAPVDVNYVNSVRTQIQETQFLKDHLFIKGNISKSEYYNLLSCCEFLFHPGYGDNGNASVYDAACCGVTSLVSDYPAMRYMLDFIKAPVEFTDPFSSEKMAVGLLKMENGMSKRLNAILIGRNIKEADYHHQAKILYSIVREMLKL